MSGQLNMDDRYGRKKSPLRVIPYLIFALLIGWLFWSATHHSNPTVAVNLISFKEIGRASCRERVSVSV